MNQSPIAWQFGVFLACLTVITTQESIAAKGSSPNLVWIIADDLGPELQCYGYPEVATPNIDRLADGGTRFTQAYATAPVCSSSRTAFVTGQYQTTVGGHHHNTRIKPVLPQSIPTVIELMQAAGYFVTNGNGTVTTRLAKSHFNFVYDSKTFFDGTDWTQRDPNQPFFATVQIKEPHRSFVRSERPRPDAPIPPYYPEHPVTRADWANYLASIEVLDQKVGGVLDRLDAEGLADSTIVIFFGDHGRPHVRGKQWLYDGGLHVPMIVRWPGKVKAGQVDDRLVSLLDLMPTTLAAAGEKVPELPGRNLLDPDFTGHDVLFAARDRCGDAVDRIRCVRTRKFKYIRNFHPELPYLQHSGYKKAGYPVETLMKVMHAQGRWDTLFMSDTRPEEELYDLSVDPHEMNNVAEDPEYQSELTQLRVHLDRWMVETNDQGRIDESKTVDIESLKAEKWKTFQRRMKSRGLDANAGDQEYLDWWKKDLGIADVNEKSIATEAKFRIPATDVGLPGAGPIRRYEWMQNVWRQRRSTFAQRSKDDHGAVVFLGDSITQGWQDDFNGDFAGTKVANRGISGDTTRGMLIRLDEDVLSLDPAAVVLLMGTNDLEELAEPRTIAGNVQLILESLKKHSTHMPIVLCEVMPSSDAKERPAAKIKQLNELLTDGVMGDPQVTVVDTWTLFAGTKGDAREEEFPDLLHPNRLGYTKWRDALIPVFETLGLLTPEADVFEIEPGFVALQNGIDLTGWELRPTPEGMRKGRERWLSRKPKGVHWPLVEERVSLDGQAQSPNGRYIALHGRIVVTTPPNGRNIEQLWTSQDFSGDFILRLQFRAMPNADSGVFLRGPQLQCRDFALAGPYKDLTRYRPQQWNDLEVVVKDNVARCTCNGEVIEEAFKISGRGPIGLEGDRGQMEYRRIRIQN